MDPIEQAKSERGLIEKGVALGALGPVEGLAEEDFRKLL